MAEKIVLKGVFTKFATRTYPNCRDYNKYVQVWNDDTETDGNWVNTYFPENAHLNYRGIEFAKEMYNINQDKSQTK